MTPTPNSAHAAEQPMSEFEPETIASTKNNIPCKRHKLSMMKHSLGLLIACLYGQPDEFGMDVQRRTYLRLKGYTHDELEAMNFEQRKQLFDTERDKTTDTTNGSSSPNNNRSVAS